MNPYLENYHKNAYKTFKAIIDVHCTNSVNEYAECLQGLVSRFVESKFDQIQQEEAKVLLFSFFEACYTHQRCDDSTQTCEKAKLIFNEILQISENKIDNNSFLYNRLYKVLRNINRYENHYEKEDFACRSNIEIFEVCYQYIGKKLKEINPKLDSKIQLDCVYYLGLLGVAHMFPALSSEGVMSDLAKGDSPQLNYPAIDEMCILLCHPAQSALLNSLIEALDALKESCSMIMHKQEAGAIKHELFVTLLEGIFRDAKPLNLDNLSQKIEKIQLFACNEDLLSDQLDEVAGAFICSNLVKLCSRQKAREWLKQIKETHPQCSEDEVLNFLMATFHLSVADQQEMKRQYKKELEQRTVSESQEVIATFILFWVAYNKLVPLTEQILSQKILLDDLKSFYTYELTYLAQEAYRCTLDEIALPQKMTHTRSTFLKKYMDLIEQQMQIFNQAHADAPLKLSCLELYDMAREELNHFMMARGSVQDPLFFQPDSPTSKGRILVLLEAGLKSIAQEIRFTNLANALDQKEEERRIQSLLTDLYQKQLKEKAWREQEEAKPIQKLQEIFDANGNRKQDPLNDKQVSVTIGKEVKNQIIESDLNVGMTIDQAKEVAKNQTKLVVNDQTYQQVEQVLGGIKNNYNDVAFAKLMEEMEKDAHITESVREKFKENWTQGNRNLFGEDISQGALLAEERRAKILKEARHLSAQAEMTVAFDDFKKRLNKDLAEGAVVPRQTVIKARYVGFFDLIKKQLQHLTAPEKKQWHQGYQKIVADALLMQEMKKLQSRSEAISGSFIENTLLQMRGLGNIEQMDVRRERHQAEVQVIKTLLEGQGLVGKELDKVKEQLEDAKLEGRLQVSKVSQEQIASYKYIIKLLDFIYKQMAEDCQAYKQECDLLNDNKLGQQKQWLLERKADLFDKVLEVMVVDTIKKVSQPAVWNGLVTKSQEEINHFICEQFESHYQMIKSGTCNDFIEEQLKPYVEFINKWKHCLKGEMIQGVVDKQECLGGGVCTGIASRWAVNDQRHPQASVEELCDPSKLKVSATDRLLQGFTSLAYRLKHFVTKTDKEIDHALVEKTFPEGFTKTLRIQNTQVLESATHHERITQEQLTSFLKKIKDNKKLPDSHGVMTMKLNFEKSAHLIYLRYVEDKKKSVFRLGEPNIGILEFQNEQEFFDCFKDLCHIFYRNEKINTIHAFQFNLS